jgi:hypothetical protein
MPRPPPSSEASPSEPPEASCSEETDPRIVLSLREPLADERLPRTVVARLILKSGLDRSHPLIKVRSVLGRGHTADVRLDDRKASRRHASIFFTGAEFRIRDESSRNGTVLNGSRVVEYAIRDGDELLIGDTLFRFHCRLLG